MSVSMPISEFNWKKYNRRQSREAQAHRLIRAFGNITMAELLDKPWSELKNTVGIGATTLEVLNKIDYLDVMTNARGGR
mgnify:CR=1 FL=1